MNTTHKLNPWRAYREEHLAPLVDALRKKESFAQFQIALWELASAFISYCRDQKHAAHAIADLKTVQDLEAYTHQELLIESVAKARCPWNWQRICEEMTKRRSNVRIHQGRKRRPISKEAAERFVTEESVVIVNAEGDVKWKNPKNIEEWRKDVCPGEGFFIMTPEEVCKRLDEGTLPAKIGYRIVEHHQDWRSTLGSHPRRLAKRKAERRTARHSRNGR